MKTTLTTLAARPECRVQLAALDAVAWPRFMMEDPAEKRHWEALFERYAEYQLLLCDEDGELLAAGYGVPLNWNGTLADLPQGWDAVLERAATAPCARPNTLSSLSIVVYPGYQGQGLSHHVLAGMKALARDRAFEHLIVPVRPTQKSHYPLVPIERYVAWRRDDGLPFDPWLRTHVRLGGQFLTIAERSMIIPGKVAEWEAWTRLRFPQTGRYTVPGALQPIDIDCERDLGVYEEPNVWMRYDVDNSRMVRPLPSSVRDIGVLLSA